MSGRLLWMGLLLGGMTAAQAPESLTAWKYYQEINGLAQSDLTMLELPLDVLDGAREDHADLRLYDANGNEVPYALRIRREVHESDAFDAQEINRGERGDMAELTLDLGPTPVPHNELDVDTAGEGFRRRVRVEGSDDGEDWSTLERDVLVFRFSSQGREVDQRRVEYPQSNYRYLRIRVEADRQIESQAPTIREVTVRRLTRSPGVDTLFPVGPPLREPGRDQGRPASIYRLDLQGRIPLRGLDLQVGQTPFSRPYRLETDAGENRGLPLASGTLRSDNDSGMAEVKLRFQEQFARRLVLTVIDDRNPPLYIQGGSAIGAARQLLFQGAGLALPLKLYYGNPDASPPHYDFDTTVPQTPPEGLPQAFLNGEQENPDYRPPQAPLTELAPWAIYLVLAIAALLILGLLRKVLGTMREES